MELPLRIESCSAGVSISDLLGGVEAVGFRCDVNCHGSGSWLCILCFDEHIVSVYIQEAQSGDVGICRGMINFVSSIYLTFMSLWQVNSRTFYFECRMHSCSLYTVASPPTLFKICFLELFPAFMHTRVSREMSLLGYMCWLTTEEDSGVFPPCRSFFKGTFPSSLGLRLQASPTSQSQRTESSSFAWT